MNQLVPWRKAPPTLPAIVARPPKAPALVFLVPETLSPAMMALRVATLLFSISIEELRDRRRRGKVAVMARRYAILRLHALGLRPTVIGRLMRRDHSTVLHHLRRLRGGA